jgi:hypothetical protein
MASAAKSRAGAAASEARPSEPAAEIWADASSVRRDAAHAMIMPVRHGMRGEARAPWGRDGEVKSIHATARRGGSGRRAP